MTQLERITAFINNIGPDIKALYSRVMPTGGTAGQILSKISNTNFAVTWSNFIDLFPNFYPNPATFKGEGASAADYFDILKVPADALTQTGTLLAVVTGINSKATGITNLFTVPTGKSLIVTRVQIICTAASAITTAPTGNVYVTAASDIGASSLMTGLTVANKAYAYGIAAATTVAPAASVIKLSITTAAAGTSQTLSAYVFGYYL